ncbi:hypothetical protein, partial [Paenibacillus larvae]|uniref:hypothetical protein n=1 Tax=Paenibacillus larvae TaxID=1464 RepID=UPI0039FC5765
LTEGYEYGSFHFLEPSFLHNYTDSTTDWVRKYKADGLDGLKESTQKGYEYVRIDELLGKDEKRPMEKPQNGGQAGTSSHEKVIT